MTRILIRAIIQSVRRSVIIKKNMKTRKYTLVVKTMKKNGWFKVRTEGSHEIYRHNDGRICPIKCTKKDIPSGTMTNIARITGLDF